MAITFFNKNYIEERITVTPIYVLPHISVRMQQLQWKTLFSKSYLLYKIILILKHRKQKPDHKKEETPEALRPFFFSKKKNHLNFTIKKENKT